MEIVYFLCTVAVITIGLMCLVRRSGRNNCRSSKPRAAGNPRVHASGGAAHAVQHPHAGHRAATSTPDIWRTRRQHAAEKARLTDTMQATHLLFDHELAAPADELSMTAVEYIPEETSSPERRSN